MTKDLYATAAETAALLREGQRYRRQRLKAADMITVTEAASLMQVDSSTMSAWIRGGRCIGVAGSDGKMKVPRWQFQPSAWSSIQLIGRSLGTRDPWQILAFFETPAPALGGLTPRVALEQGVPIARVLAAATGDSS
jgi:hypothetical protein